MSGAAPARTLAFLRELWPDGLPAGSTLNLWTPGARATCAATLEHAATLLASGERTYLPCAAMRPVERGRGGAADARALPGFWLDLDTRGGAHKASAELLPTKPEALALLDALPVPPSLVLDSGGGLYPWWLFEETWALDDDTERERATALLHQWQGFVQDQARAHGWEVDGTANLDRVLRAEGTLNHKYDPARPVVRVRDGGPRYNPSDFELWSGEYRSGAATSKPRTATSTAPAEPLTFSGVLPSGDVDAATWARAEQALRFVEPNERDTWLRVGMALRTMFGDQGLPLWDAWSRETKAGNYDAGTQRAQWRSFRPGDGTAATVNEGTLWKLARDGGWEEGADELDPALFPEGARRVSFEDAEAELPRLVEDAAAWAAERKGIAVVATPPGIGKTAAVFELMRANPHSAYFGASYKLLEEKIREYGGETQVREGLLRSCLKPGARVAADSGQALGYRLACEGCDRRDICPPHQRMKPGVPIFAPHAARLEMKGAEGRRGKPDRIPAELEGRDPIIIDEMPGDVLDTVALTERQVSHAKDARFGTSSEPYDEGQLELMHRALDALGRLGSKARTRDTDSKYGAHLHGRELAEAWANVAAELNGAAEAVLFAAQAGVTAYRRPNPVALRDGTWIGRTYAPPELGYVFRALVRTVVRYGDAPDDWKADGDWASTRPVGHSGTLRVVRNPVAADDGSHVVFELRAPHPLAPPGKGVVLLDATAHLEMDKLKASNPGSEVRVFALNVEPSTEGEVRRVWLKTSASRRGMLAAGPERMSERGHQTVRWALGEIERIAPDWLGGPADMSVVTFWKIEAELRDAIGPASDDDSTDRIRLRHALHTGRLATDAELVGYYGRDERGANRFQGASVNVTLGDPWPNKGAMEADARALGLEDADALAAAKMRADLVQAVGRSREVRVGTGDLPAKKLLVHVGSVCPPGWRGRCEVVERPQGRPPHPLKEALQALAWSELAEGRPVAVWAWEKARGGSAETALSRYLRALSAEGSPWPAERTVREWVAEVAGRFGATKIGVLEGEKAVFLPPYADVAQARRYLSETIGRPVAAPEPAPLDLPPLPAHALDLAAVAAVMADPEPLLVEVVAELAACGPTGAERARNVACAWGPPSGPPASVGGVVAAALGQAAA